MNYTDNSGNHWEAAEHDDRGTGVVFRHVFDNAAIGIAVADRNGRFLQANDAFRRMVGYSIAELQEMTFLELTHPDDRARNARLQNELRHGRRERFVVDKRYISKSGRIIFVRLSVARLHDEQGELQNFVGVAEDITQQKQAEAALLQSRELLSVASSLGRLGGWVIDVPTMQINWSEEIRQIAEVAPGHDPTLKEALNWYAQPGRDTMRKAFFACLHHGKPYDLELPFVTATGRRLWTRSIGNAVRDEKGNIVRLQGAFQDITERKEAEQELRYKDSLLRIAGKVARIGGWALAKEGRQVYWSEEVCALLGYPPGVTPSLEEAMAHYPPGYRELITRALEACLQNGTPFDLELELITATGQRIWARCRGEAERNKDGEIIRAHGAFQDISEQKEAARTLGQSQERFRVVADAMPFIIWTSEPDGAVDYANSLFTRYTGVPVEDLPYGGWIGSLHPDDTQRAIDRWQESVRSGGRYEIEFRVRRAFDGAYRWHLLRSVPYHDENGKIVKWYGSGIDIHDTKLLEEEARLLAQRLSNTLESITDAFFALDSEWRFTYVNQEAEEMMQQSRARLLGRSVWQAFPEALGGPVEHHFRLSVHERRAVAFEVYFEAWQKWLDVRVYPTADGLAVYFHDITEQREARERLQASEERLREQAALLDKTSDAILVKDLDNKITFWNQSASRIYGWQAEEVVGRPATDVLYYDAKAFYEATRQTLAKGEWHGELQQRRRDGRPVLVEGRWSLVHDEAGQPKAVMSVNTDISEHKKLEEQFLRAQRMESIGTLTGGIAHDLNNVLSPILLSIPLLKRNMRDEGDRRRLELLEKSAQRGADMVRQLLTFARGASGERVTVRLDVLLHEVQQLLHDTLGKNIQIDLSIPEAPWSIEGDPTQLQQVLVNLSVNARDAMPDGGRLLISLDNLRLDEQFAAAIPEVEPGPYVRLTVADTGGGIPPEIRERIFEPFFTTKKTGRGTGLGLSTVRGIVKGHGGFIDVESQVQQGTVFTIYLPAQLDKSVAEAPSAPVSPVWGSGELILVVDDETVVRSIMQQTLGAFGYHVLLAQNGQEGVQLYASNREEIAAVVTDIMMPVMDGVAMIRALRQFDSDVKIIAASGLGTEEMLGKLSAMGVEQFLHKPFGAEALLQSLATVLGKA